MSNTKAVVVYVPTDVNEEALQETVNSLFEDKDPFNRVISITQFLSSLLVAELSQMYKSAWMHRMGVDPTGQDAADLEAINWDDLRHRSNLITARIQHEVKKRSDSDGKIQAMELVGIFASIRCQDVMEYVNQQEVILFASGNKNA